MSALEALPLMVSQSAATQLSVMISNLTELCERTNPGFNCGGSLVDVFLRGIDSFSLAISKSTGSFCANKSPCQLWKQCR
jgi:hypothetical protein